MTDDDLIRQLIERWARAVHAGDLDAVLADHAADIVMFDVPPPDDGVRGIDAYRDCWPPNFRVAAAGGGLRPGRGGRRGRRGRGLRPRAAALRTPEALAKEPDRRLRLTLGLRREAGRWVVAHEHHSFPLG
jgi:ketosteroid isomerase-like protein